MKYNMSKQHQEIVFSARPNPDIYHINKNVSFVWNIASLMGMEKQERNLKAKLAQVVSRDRWQVSPSRDFW